MAMNPHGAGDGYFVVDKGPQDVLHTPARDGYVHIDDLGGTFDAPYDVNRGRSGLCIDAVQNAVAVETIYGAMDGRSEGCGHAVADGKVLLAALTMSPALGVNVARGLHRRVIDATLAIDGLIASR